MSDNISQESNPMDLTESHETNLANFGKPDGKLDRPPRNFGKMDNLRSIQELPAKYRCVFDFPFFNIIQSQILDDMLYSDTSVVVSAPTGSGKTVVFELAIIKLLMNFEETNFTGDYKIIYVAPLKSLCNERLADWHTKFSKIGLSCIVATGDTDNIVIRNLSSYNIIITTPEKWDSLTRNSKDNEILKNVKLFFIDEVHLLNEEARGPNLEVVVSRLKLVPDQKIRFVAVSATIPNLDDIAVWLGRENNPAVYFKIGEELRPVKLKKVVLGYPCVSENSNFKFDLSLNYKLQSVILEHAEQKSTLIFCSTRKGVEITATHLSNTLTFHLSPDQLAALSAAASSMFSAVHKGLLARGIGCHHAGMSLENRITIEGLFKDGHLPVLVATSTLAMGVNLPAHLVIVKGTSQYVGGSFQEYSETSILQMIGRAGRPKFDTSATVVIMTTTKEKSRYEKMLEGKELIESNLHRHLTEHLNAEVVLGTITDIAIALEWLRYTFLYIRVLKNPKHYNIPTHFTKQQIEKRLQDWCQIEINALHKHGMLQIDQTDGFSVIPTNMGSLMANYYLRFDTMKLFAQIDGKEDLSQILMLICKCSEFADVYLRVNDKKTLNTLNKCKYQETIRFPMKGVIKTTPMKINCIIQAILGCIRIQNPTLHQEAINIMRIGEKVSKCLVTYLMHKPKFFQAFSNALIISQCFSAKIWENSPYVSRQFPKIGNVLSSMLVTAGKKSFKTISETSARDIERIINRAPPMGNEILDAVMHLPNYKINIESSGIDSLQLNVTVTLLNSEDIYKKCTAGSQSYMTLLIGDTENNTLVYKKLYHHSMASCKDHVQYVDALIQTNHTIYVHLISENWVGIDCSEKYDVFTNTNATSTKISDNSKLNILDKDKNKKDITAYFKTTKNLPQIKENKKPALKNTKTTNTLDSYFSKKKENQEKSKLGYLIPKSSEKNTSNSKIVPETKKPENIIENKKNDQNSAEKIGTQFENSSKNTNLDTGCPSNNISQNKTDLKSTNNASLSFASSLDDLKTFMGHLTSQNTTKSKENVSDCSKPITDYYKKILAGHTTQENTSNEKTNKDNNYSGKILGKFSSISAHDELENSSGYYTHANVSNYGSNNRSTSHSVSKPCTDYYTSKSNSHKILTGCTTRGNISNCGTNATKTNENSDNFEKNTEQNFTEGFYDEFETIAGRNTHENVLNYGAINKNTSNSNLNPRGDFYTLKNNNDNNFHYNNPKILTGHPTQGNTSIYETNASKINPGNNYSGKRTENNFPRSFYESQGGLENLSGYYTHENVFDDESINFEENSFTSNKNRFTNEEQDFADVLKTFPDCYTQTDYSKSNKNIPNILDFDFSFDANIPNRKNWENSRNSVTFDENLQVFNFSPEKEAENMDFPTQANILENCYEPEVILTENLDNSDNYFLRKNDKNVRVKNEPYLKKFDRYLPKNEEKSDKLLLDYNSRPALAHRGDFQSFSQNLAEKFPQLSQSSRSSSQRTGIPIYSQNRKLARNLSNSELEEKMMKQIEKNRIVKTVLSQFKKTPPKKYTRDAQTSKKAPNFQNEKNTTIFEPSQTQSDNSEINYFQKFNTNSKELQKPRTTFENKQLLTNKNTRSQNENTQSELLKSNCDKNSELINRSSNIKNEKVCTKVFENKNSTIESGKKENGTIEDDGITVESDDDVTVISSESSENSLNDDETNIPTEELEKDANFDKMSIEKPKFFNTFREYVQNSINKLKESTLVNEYFNYDIGFEEFLMGPLNESDSETNNENEDNAKKDEDNNSDTDNENNSDAKECDKNLSKSTKSNLKENEANDVDKKYNENSSKHTNSNLNKDGENSNSVVKKCEENRSEPTKSSPERINSDSNIIELMSPENTEFSPRNSPILENMEDITFTCSGELIIKPSANRNSPKNNFPDLSFDSNIYSNRNTNILGKQEINIFSEQSNLEQDAILPNNSNLSQESLFPNYLNFSQDSIISTGNSNFGEDGTLFRHNSNFGHEIIPPYSSNCGPGTILPHSSNFGQDATVIPRYSKFRRETIIPRSSKSGPGTILSHNSSFGQDDSVLRNSNFGYETIPLHSSKSRHETIVPHSLKFHHNSNFGRVTRLPPNSSAGSETILPHYSNYGYETIVPYSSNSESGTILSHSSNFRQDGTILRHNSNFENETTTSRSSDLRHETRLPYRSNFRHETVFPHSSNYYEHETIIPRSNYEHETMFPHSSNFEHETMFPNSSNFGQETMLPDNFNIREESVVQQFSDLHNDITIEGRYQIIEQFFDGPIFKQENDENIDASSMRPMKRQRLSVAQQPHLFKISETRKPIQNLPKANDTFKKLDYMKPFLQRYENQDKISIQRNNQDNCHPELKETVYTRSDLTITVTEKKK